MEDKKFNIHFVCTFEEGQEFIKQHEKFWVSDCGCRLENKNGCSRSRMDVCLGFFPGTTSSQSNLREAHLPDVEKILQEAKEKHLVPRPFRNMEDKNKVEGVCFCCDDCCGYFKEENESCDKGKYIQKTDFDSCIHCGECVSVCYFKARKMNDSKLEVNDKNCYGCGLCRDVCPVNCITMTDKT